MTSFPNNVDKVDAKHAPGALAGLRVIDASRILGGPLCGQTLGDHGADVLKVESPKGDDTRAWGPPFSSTSGIWAYYSGLNRNKRIAVIDMGQPAGVEQRLGLLEGADVLIENFKQHGSALGLVGTGSAGALPSPDPLQDLRLRAGRPAGWLAGL